MPSVKDEGIRKINDEYVMQTWSVHGQGGKYLCQGEGIYVYDEEGNKYADMSSMLVCSNLGHSNQYIKDEMKKQIDQLSYVSPSFVTKSKALLAKKIVDLCSNNMQRVLFCSSGTEANEDAIKIARQVTGRSKILSRYKSYHGSTLGASSASGDWRRFEVEHNAASGFIKFRGPYPYIENHNLTDGELSLYYLQILEEQIIYEGRDNIAAIILEAIIGSNGIIIPPDGYLQGIRKICDKYGILMICDEVMTGFYRTGKPFAFQHFSIEPDMVTFAKGVTSAYIPLGGVVVSKNIANYFNVNKLSCGHTYSGHTLACSTGLAAITCYEDWNIESKVVHLGKILGEFLERIKGKYSIVGDARCIGLFSCIEIKESIDDEIPISHYGEKRNDAEVIKKNLANRGFLTFGRENYINIAPPLIITEEELTTYLNVFEHVLAEFEDNI